MKRNWLAAGAVLTVLALPACSHLHSGSAAAASGSAGAHAVATSSAGTVGKQIVKACVPQNALAEAKWFGYMASGPHSKHAQQGAQTRQAFSACAGIPHAKMAAFENQVLTDAAAAARSALSPKVTVKQAGEKFLGTTLPEDVVKYRG